MRLSEGFRGLWRRAMILSLMGIGGILLARLTAPQGAQATHPPQKPIPLLVAPEDLAGWGKVFANWGAISTITVTVLVPASPLEKGSPATIPFLNGWEEGYTTAMAISVPGQYSVGIVSQSYRFPSPAAARAALQNLPNPQSTKWLSEQPSQLDPEVARLLEHHAIAWRLWYGINSEGFPTHILWLQSGPYLAHVSIEGAVPIFLKDIIAAGPFASEAELAQKYLEILQNYCCGHLTDVEASRAIGQQVLHHVARALVKDVR